MNFYYKIDHETPVFMLFLFVIAKGLYQIYIQADKKMSENAVMEQLISY